MTDRENAPSFEDPAVDFDEQGKLGKICTDRADLAPFVHDLLAGQYYDVLEEVLPQLISNYWRN